jgi:antirestriction protein ArdC
MTTDIYTQVTDRIIAQLEKGAAPWVKPWSSKARGTQRDHNLVSGEAYKGINRVILGMSGFSSSTWATFNQWKAKGASVRKGEKGTHIVFFKPVTKTETGADGQEKTSSFAVMKSYVVFNADQVNGYEESAPAGNFTDLESAEDRIANTGAHIQHGGDRAFFAPAYDLIQLPAKASFKSEAHYYATAFHELTHWSGAESRLDRTFGSRFGDPKYAFEELVAEMGAAFLCADYGVDGDLRHAGYIANWLQALHDDNTAVFKAAALAQKAADYINGLDATAQQLKAA